MVHHSEFLRRRVVHVQHVLEPVGALRHTHVHPVGLFVGHATMPGLLKAQNVLIEGVSPSPVLDHYAQVNDALRNARLWEKLAEITAVQGTWHELHELNVVIVGVEDIEAAISIQHGLQFFRHFDATTGKVGAHLLDIGGLKRNMGQSILLGIVQFRKNFDVLMIVDFEISQQQLAGRIVDGERFLKSQDARVELTGRGKVVGSQTDVSHTDDGGASYGLRLLLQPTPAATRTEAKTNPKILFMAILVKLFLALSRTA